MRKRKRPVAAQDTSSESYPAAALLCMAGIAAHLLLSAPVLNTLGIPYGSDGGNLLTKIHPGSYLILTSFFVLVFSRNNPFDQIIRIARQQTAFFAFFVICGMALVYWAARGPKGVGLMADVHMVMPAAAIVMSYAPSAWYKRICYAVISFALLNAAVGIFESATHTRIFSFDPDWEVLQQDYFRASALMGHPLANAAFEAVALFLLLSLPMPMGLKSAGLMLLLAGLVAFGGRSALILGVGGLLLFGVIAAWKFLRGSEMTVQRLTLILLIVLTVPALGAGFLYGIMQSGIGERLMAYSSMEDDSAEVRRASLSVIQYMTPADIIFGVDGDREIEIADNLDVGAPTTDIENPWVLMFIFLGVLMFTLWLGGLGATVLQLMTGAPLALQFAIVDYFAIASTSNSFGRKDPVYAILGGIIVCFKKFLTQRKKDKKAGETYL